MYRLLSFLVLSVLIMPQTIAFAQDDTPSNKPISGRNALQNGEAIGPLKCFDHYTFGSVSADITATAPTTIPGSSIAFEGSVINENPYPLLDGTLYVKIFKRDETTFAAGDSNEVVDQFVVKDNITLSGNGSLPLSYEWKVPVNVAAGEYYAAYFYTTAERYSLLGLTFTDDVVGNQAPFSIVREDATLPVKLNKIDTTINGQDHQFASFPLFFPYEEALKIETSITNPSDSARTVPLQWSQYTWDGNREENRRHTKTELVTLAAGETKIISYDVAPQPESVVFVTATTQDNESKSILNIRFVRDGVPETRLNFPGISSFPFKANELTTLFTCAHSTNLPEVPDNVITLTLSDRDGGIIHEYRYEGNLTGAMSGFGESFTPTKNINYALLTATLERDGMLIDRVTQTYDCNSIDAGTCLPEDSSTNFNMTDFIMDNLLIIGGIAILLLLLLLMFFKRRSKAPPVGGNGPVMTKPLSLILLGGLIPTLFLLGGGVAEAASVQVGGVSQDFNVPIYDNVKLDHDANFTVTYFADVINHDTNALIANGEQIPVGTKLRFVPKPRIRTGETTSDIQWNQNSTVQGTPFGYWNTPNNFCDYVDYIGEGFGAIDGLVTVFTPYTVQLVSEVITNSGVTLNDLGGGVYETASDGILTVNFNFPVATGYFGYQHTRQNSGNRCFGTGFAEVAVPEANITFNITVGNPPPANNPPSAPAITGPITGTTNTSYNFTIEGGNDPDAGAQIKYQVDWNNDGIFNAGDGDFETGLMAPLSSAVVFRSWSANGAAQFQARTVDNVGASSGWTVHTITINPAPPATADLTINNSNGPLTVNTGDTLTLSWTSTNAPSCTLYGQDIPSGSIAVGPTGTMPITATNSDTYVAVCGTATPDQVVVTVVNPNPPTATLEARVSNSGWSTADQTVNPGDSVVLRWNSQNASTCTGSGSGFTTGNNTSGSDTVTTPTPNTSETFTVNCSGSGGSGGDSLSITTRQLPNFSQPNIRVATSSTFNPTTGAYDYIDWNFQTSNTGGSDTNTNANFEFQFDRNRDGYEVTETGNLGRLSTSATVSRNGRVSGNIPFGKNGLRVMVDNDNDVAESNEADNERVLDFIIGPPDPGLSITADKTQLRNGETTTIRWTTTATYPLNCSVTGPGTNVNPATLSGNRLTAPLNAKSIFIFTCTEPTTGTVFSDSVAVETQGVIEET